MTKVEMRDLYLTRRRQLSRSERELADRRIVNYISQLPEMQGCKTIVAYLSDGTEPDLRPLLRQQLELGQKIYLPRFMPHCPAQYEFVQTDMQPHELQIGKYGIMEPVADLPAAVPDNSNALWLIPGVAFDRDGNRLGRGKGVYDRLLAAASSQPLAVGVFYQCQQAVQVPATGNDYRLDIIVTESGITRINNGVEYE